MRHLLRKRALLVGAPFAALTFALTLLGGHVLRPAPTTVTEDASNPHTVLVDLKGKDEPLVTVRMAEGVATLIEFPQGDEVAVMHFGQWGVVEPGDAYWENTRTVVLRSGPEFPTTKARREDEGSSEEAGNTPPPAPASTPSASAAPENDIQLDDAQRASLGATSAQLKEQMREWDELNASWAHFQRAADELRYGPGGRAATVLTIQMKSGVTLTFRVVAVESVDEADYRVVVSYDRDQVKNAVRAPGTAPAYADPDLGY